MFRDAIRSAQTEAIALDGCLVAAHAFEPVLRSTVPDWKGRSKRLKALLVGVQAVLSDETLGRGLDESEAQINELRQCLTATAEA